MKHRFIQTCALAAFAACASLTAAQAAPTARVIDGTTAVTLSGSFGSALAALGIAAGPSKPATAVAVPGSLTLRFPIPGGRIDLGTAKADILHTGGIRLTGSAAVVELSHFIIDTTAAPVISGVVVLNGTLVGRVPLFDLGLAVTPPLTPAPNGKLILAPVAVTLNAGAAAALNTAFGTAGFVGGFPLGTAKVSLKTK
jgi:hypothetical protein